MLKKTILSSVTAGLIAAGALTATTGTASAHNPTYQSQTNGHQHGYNVRQRRACKPIFRQVHWRDRWGRTHWKRVQVGQNCHRVQKRRPFRQQRGWYGNHNGFSFQFSW